MVVFDKQKQLYMCTPLVLKHLKGCDYTCSSCTCLLLCSPMYQCLSGSEFQCCMAFVRGVGGVTCYL